MRRTVTHLLAGFALATTVAAAPAASSAPADHEVEMVLGDSVHIDGGAPQGMNPDYFDTTGQGLGGQCTKDVSSYCEWTLVHVVTEVPADAKGGRLKSNLGLTLTSPDFPLSDFDLVLWESNADGERLEQVGYSGSGGYVDAVESMSIKVQTTPEIQDAWFLVDVVYYFGGPNYDLDITFD